MAMMSILGLYNVDGTIFDQMTAPTVFSAANKETLIDEILFQCCELEILYPDPDVMKLAIKRWSEAELPSWNRYADALNLQYEALWNVDANVSETVAREGETTTSGTDTDTYNLHITTGYDKTIETDGTDTLASTAFNVTEFRNRDRSTGTAETTESNDGTENKTGTLANSKNLTDSSESSETHTIRRTGNIGVTSSQQLVEQEIALATYNIMRYIVDSFKKRFCILVY